jgi:uncharacterized circularly permuted ATP-grasp superfamily protein
MVDRTGPPTPEADPTESPASMAGPLVLSAHSRALQRAMARRCVESGADLLAERRAAMEAEFRRRGIDFLVNGGERYFRRLDEVGCMTLDPIPYPVTAADWDRIAAGYAQRLAVFDDLIRALVDRDESLLPGPVLDTCDYDRAALAILAEQPRAVTFVGSDAMIDNAGRVRLVEDNPCAAAGCGYGALISEATARLVPEFADYRGCPVIEVGRAIRRVHEELCDTVSTPLIIFVSHGPGDPNFVENVLLAESAGFVLTDPEDVSVGADGTVRLRLGNGTTRVVDMVVCNHSRRYRLGAQLLAAVANGRARVVNHPATFALADKYLFGCVPELIRRRFGQPPLLDQPPTIPMLAPADRAAVFADVREYVVKPRRGLGGTGVMVGAYASDEQIRDMREAVSRQPSQYLAQPRVASAGMMSLRRGAGPAAFIRSSFDIRISGYAGTGRPAIPEPVVRADLNGTGLVNVSAGGTQKAMYRSTPGVPR